MEVEITKLATLVSGCIASIESLENQFIKFRKYDDEMDEFKSAYEDAVDSCFEYYDAGVHCQMLCFC